MAAAVVVLVLPMIAGVQGTHSAPSRLAAVGRPSLHEDTIGGGFVARRMTGTVVCLECEARHEAGLCPLPQARHEAAFCAENGEVWRLMPRDPALLRQTEGQTVTVEGVAFPRSGFLRASRVGY